MKKGLYYRLAWTGIRKNRKLYLPYLLTCIGMVMMFYIVSFLTTSQTLTSMPGGDTTQSILTLGCGVIGFFSLLFLFYTNSFLIRRRKKEFGLYNILGMGKRNLARVLIWEGFLIAVISIAAGLFLGILFSKLAELCMVNILSADVTFSMSVDLGSIVQTLLLFAVIFLLILLNSLRQIHLSKPIELLQSENMGEKPPRSNWLLAIVGMVILAGAYYLAVTIENPVSALVWFFVAVIMVILATYLLFISGSVAICRLLQKKKNYYYKTSHFVSISSMVYRMKRNGAGLASICILCTMVLVMLSSTVCLYSGAENSLRSRYPRNINLDLATTGDVDSLQSKSVEEVKTLSAQVLSEYGQELQNVLDYRVASFAGYLNGDTVELDTSSLLSFQLSEYSNVWQIFIVPLEDYNRLMEQEESLNPGEALIYTTKTGYGSDTITIGDTETLQIRKKVADFADNGVDAMQIVPSLYLFVPNFEEYVNPLLSWSDFNGDRLVQLHWYYGFDLSCDAETQIEIQAQLEEALKPLAPEEDGSLRHILCEGVAKERNGFYGMYGGLFFLGILLGLVFVFAAVLIMYYKQVSEGYEDQSRFGIMQKVGMTKREIKRSINSQVLTVFFLPLIASGVHLAFAFPLISKLLVLFGLTNITLLIGVTVCCFLLFAVLYVLVYRITSKAYYSIVSGAKEEQA